MITFEQIFCYLFVVHMCYFGDWMAHCRYHAPVSTDAMFPATSLFQIDLIRKLPILNRFTITTNYSADVHGNSDATDVVLTAPVFPVTDRPAEQRVRQAEAGQL